MKIRSDFRHTRIASYIGYITQAVVNNFAPLLFLTFSAQFSLSLSAITLLITVNFCTQLIVDLLAARFVDKIGYRTSVVFAHFCAAGGLCGLAFFPFLFSSAYAGLLVSVILYAVGGGLIEVVDSPIMEACPSDNKSASMSLLHSFYCWGQVGVVALSTLFFAVCGIENWRILSLCWAVIPFLNGFYFLLVPINKLTEDGESLPIRKLLSMRLFWLFVLLMLCAGASELAMSQWSSAFAEKGLGISKSIGDLAGPCAFALLMGASRVLYAKCSEKIDLSRYIVISSVLCIGGYLLAVFAPHPVVGLCGCAICGFAVGCMWPGTYSIASKACPKGGTAMFALLALAGDCGCTLGPTLVGFVSGLYGDNLSRGLAVGLIFPAILLCGILRLRSLMRKKPASKEPDE